MAHALALTEPAAAVGDHPVLAGLMPADGVRHRRAGTTPANNRDDLPVPEAPATTRKRGAPCSRR